MGEQQKPEEQKVEEVGKPQEKKEEAKSPSPLILSVDLHCIGCAKKIQKFLLGITGVVGVETDMVKNQVTIKGEVEPQAVCNKIMKKTKRNVKVLSPVTIPVTEGEESITKIEASEIPGLTTLELNVNMHCEACAQQLRRHILKMKGVTKVETEVSSGKVTVVGSMDGEKLVEYVYRRTKKQAKIVPQPEPDQPQSDNPKKEEEKKNKEEDNGGEDGKKEKKKKEEEGGDDENPLLPEEEKKHGGDDKKKDDEEEDKEEEESMQMQMMQQRMMYNNYYQYHQQQQPFYVMERIPPPQLFSDENPNACSIS